MLNFNNLQLMMQFCPKSISRDTEFLSWRKLKFTSRQILSVSGYENSRLHLYMRLVQLKCIVALICTEISIFLWWWDTIEELNASVYCIFCPYNCWIIWDIFFHFVVKLNYCTFKEVLYNAKMIVIQDFLIFFIQYLSSLDKLYFQLNHMMRHVNLHCEAEDKFSLFCI